MEESSHSTPSPMSSAASSQDSLHRNAATLHYHQLHHQNPYGSLMTNTLPANTHLGLVGNKKKGVKSTLGRIFGKKDKGHMKAMHAAHGVKSPAGSSLGSPQVSGPIPNSASLSGGFLPAHPLHTSTGLHNYAGSECDLPTSDSMSIGLGSMSGGGGPKGDFDRRKKKRYDLSWSER